MLSEIVTMLANQLPLLGKAAVSLPVAGLLGAMLAFRPRRTGTPKCDLEVIHTQIILGILSDDLSPGQRLPSTRELARRFHLHPNTISAGYRQLAQIILGIVGALVMLIIGESLARAFGIVGAAGLIRYRASIQDPKDAGVMLSTLGLGLASGVGLYLLAAAGALFLVQVLWIIESKHPKPRLRYRLKVACREPIRLQPKIEAVLRSHRVPYELIDYTDDEIAYDIQLPIDQLPDVISIELNKLQPEGVSFTMKRKKVA